MLKNIVLKQKQDKEQLLSLPYIERTKTNEAKKWLDSNLIKVVLGPRRSGKSVFSLMLLKDRPFAYFNFDDEAILEKDYPDYTELMYQLKSVYGETKNILFDEIQNLPKWELFVNRLQREGYNLLLTGSNANLLSKELSTALTGRHIPIEILPFNFKEFLQAKQYQVLQNNLLSLTEEYLINGSYPEVTTKNLDLKGYLDVLFDSLLFKDVVKRHKVRFSGEIDNLGSYLVNNFSTPYSLRKLTQILGFRSGVTLEKYVSYLTEAYMLFSLHRYSYKAGERLGSPKKIYVVDNGFVTAKAVQNSPDNGKLLENLMFTELVKKGSKPNRDLFYYRTRNDREVDFVLKQGTTITELIQVAYEVKDQNTEQREIKAIIEAGEELRINNLTVITWNEKREIKKGDFVVHLIPFWERFLD